MGFVNGVNCCLVLVGSYAIAARLFPAPGRAVFAGFLACFVAVLLRAGAPMPDALRPLVPLEAVLVAVAAAAPHLTRKVPALARESTEARTNGIATGVAVGRFVLESWAAFWAALPVPGFTWDALLAAGMLPVNLLVALAVVAAVRRLRLGIAPACALAAGLQVASVLVLPK